MIQIRMSWFMLSITLLLSGAMLFGQDTVPQGVIRVSKTTLSAYVMVQYKMQLAAVAEVVVEVPANNGVEGSVELDKIPFFDSARYSKKFHRVYPRTTFNFSKHYASYISYKYVAADTQKIDTMILGMWITPKGIIKWTEEFPYFSAGMDDILIEQLYVGVRKLNTWGEGGGYKTMPKWYKRSTFVPESYYCEMMVLVSPKPLSVEQKNTGSVWAPFDVPLNVPTADKQQEDFKRRVQR
jgi:hypothetical protein